MIGMKNIELALAELPEGVLTRLECDDEGIVVVRRGTNISAFIDVCPHAGWKLSEGELVEPTTLECPGHVWKFDLQTGSCIDVPAYELTAVTVVQQGDRVSFQW